MTAAVSLFQQAVQAFRSLGPAERRIAKDRDFVMNVGPFEIEVFQRSDGENLHLRLVIENTTCRDCDDWKRVRLGVQKGGKKYLAHVTPISDEHRYEAILDVPDQDGYRIAIELSSRRTIPRRKKSVH